MALLASLFGGKRPKSDMRIFVENSHTADIQRFESYWIAAWAVSIRPRWRGMRLTGFQVVMPLCLPF